MIDSDIACIFLRLDAVNVNVVKDILHLLLLVLLYLLSHLHQIHLLFHLPNFVHFLICCGAFRSLWRVQEIFLFLLIPISQGSQIANVKTLLGTSPARQRSLVAG